MCILYPVLRHGSLLSVSLESQACPVACPSVKSQELAPALMLLAEVFWHAATDLGEGAAHDLAKVALYTASVQVSM